MPLLNPGSGVTGGSRSSIYGSGIAPKPAAPAARPATGPSGGAFIAGGVGKVFTAPVSKRDAAEARITRHGTGNTVVQPPTTFENGIHAAPSQQMAVPTLRAHGAATNRIGQPPDSVGSLLYQGAGAFPPPSPYCFTRQQTPQTPQTPQPPLGTSTSASVTPPPQTSSAAPQPSPKRRGKPRRAKTARDLRTAASATSREDSYWNKEYQPSALATDPLKCNPAGIRGWVDPDGIRRPERSLERRKLIPQVDIGYYEPNGRGAGVKEAGLPAISQAFKESLRSTYVEQFDKLEGSEASVEHLRKLLAKAAGERLPLFEY